MLKRVCQGEIEHRGANRVATAQLPVPTHQLHRSQPTSLEIALTSMRTPVEVSTWVMVIALYLVSEDRASVT